MFKPLVSIIVRTKNESFWIGKCMHAIENQSYTIGVNRIGEDGNNVCFNGHSKYSKMNTY